ncbi:MAG: hypothetical protein MJ248_06850, partial [Bacilli bacterium]|nr:hypothetical protein [Bacilli bacterium]
YTTAEGQYSKVYDLDEDVGAGLPFKVICDAGYGVKNIEVTPATVDSQKTYKNIKTPENTKVENGYKITWVYTDIQVKVNVVSASELLPGRKVTFNVPTGAQLTVYKDKNFTVVDPTADYYLTRDSDGTPEADGGLPYSTGAKAAIYFKVLVPAGKTFTVTIDPKEAVNKSEAANAEIAGSWKITKITADINITIAIVDAPAA